MSNMRCSQRLTVKKKLRKRHFTPCKHTVSPAFQTLFATLPGQRTCAECLIKGIMHTLRRARTQIEQRGGIFLSKEKNKVDHDWWVDHWRMASVQGFQVMGLLERFGEQVGGSEMEKDEAKRVVGIWKKYRRKASVLPGIEVESGQDEDEELDVDLLMTYIRMMVEKLVREVDEEDKKGISIARTDSHQIGVEDISAPEATEAIPHQANIETTSPPGDDGLRSCLKRKCTTGSIVSKHKSVTKRVKFAGFTMVSSDHYNIIAHPFSPVHRKEPTIESHRLEAALDYKGSKSLFRRNSNLYRPGRWSSPKGYEKQNTSWWNTKWWDFDRPFGVMEIEDKEWEEQWNEGSRVASVLKEICETWMARRKLLGEDTELAGGTTSGTA